MACFVGRRYILTVSATRRVSRSRVTSWRKSDVCRRLWASSTMWTTAGSSNTPGPVPTFVNEFSSGWCAQNGSWTPKTSSPPSPFLPSGMSSISKAILDLCSNMVTIDDNGRFRFAHLSVREYLETLPAYDAAECHAFVLQRSAESYINTSGPPWTSQSDVTLDWRIRPYSTLYWPEHCRGVIGTHTTDFLQTAKAFIFRNGASCATYGEAFPDWLSEAWNSSQYSFAIQCDPITLEKLASAAASPANPLFVACAFDIAWIPSSMNPADLAELDSLRNYQDEPCIQVAIKWKSWAAPQWLVTNCPVDSSTQTDALWAVLECSHEDLDVPCGIFLGGWADGFAVAEGHELRSASHYAVKFGLVEVARLVLMSRQHFKPRTFFWIASTWYTRVLLPLKYSPCSGKLASPLIHIRFSRFCWSWTVTSTSRIGDQRMLRPGEYSPQSWIIARLRSTGASKDT